jgi:hypothetical protein
VATADEATAPSRMEQSVDVGGALLQLVQRESQVAVAAYLRNASASTSRAL